MKYFLHHYNFCDKLLSLCILSNIKGIQQIYGDGLRYCISFAAVYKKIEVINAWSFSEGNFLFLALPERREYYSNKWKLCISWPLDVSNVLFYSGRHSHSGNLRSSCLMNTDRYVRVRHPAPQKTGGYHGCAFSTSTCVRRACSHRDGKWQVSSLNPPHAKGQMAPFSVGRSVHMCEIHTPTEGEH